MTASPGIAELYVAAVDSFIDVARTLTPEEWSRPAPCTPGWTARDLLSHVSGIPDDALAGRLDGVATEPWTASQVERNAVFTVDELLDRWTEQYRPFAEAIESMGQGRPPFDCHTHEHDLRHAVGRLGGRDHPVVDALANEATGALEDVPASLTIDFTDGATHAAGGGGPAATVSLSRFEYFRSRFGRRSAARRLRLVRRPGGHRRGAARLVVLRHRRRGHRRVTARAVEFCASPVLRTSRSAHEPFCARSWPESGPNRAQIAPGVGW